MFVVKFWHGLGNQMFEYALLKQLEKHYPMNNIRGYIANCQTKRFDLKFCLDNVFGIHINECNWKKVAKLSDFYPETGVAYPIIRPIYNKTSYLFGHKSTHIYQDNFTCFYPEIYSLSTLSSYYFEGVWANHEYLVGIEDILMHDFTFRDGLSDRNNEYIKKINGSNSVSVHVRRGNYVKLGCLMTTDDYYMKAIETIKAKVDNPVFFVFSNDHGYCRKLFEGKIRYEIVEGNEGNDSFRDMQLMSTCKHNIIANSTFSFWGAYLNRNQNKIVIAPNIGVFENAIPFACPEWITIDS